MAEADPPEVDSKASVSGRLPRVGKDRGGDESDESDSSENEEMEDVASEDGGVEGRELEGELVKGMQSLDLTDSAEQLKSVSPKATTDEEAAVTDDDSRGGP